MSTVIDTPFTWSLGDDAALILRTAAIAEAHFALVQVNYQRLARWFPDAFQEPPVLEVTRANLQEAGQAWQEGSLPPLSIAVRPPARGRPGRNGMRPATAVPHDPPPTKTIEIPVTIEVPVDGTTTEALQVGASALGGVGIALGAVWIYRPRHPMNGRRTRTP